MRGLSPARDTQGWDLDGSMKRLRDLLVSAGFALLLIAGGILTLVRGWDDSDYLYYENRNRTELPELSAAALADGAFMSGLESYLADRVPLRLTMLIEQTRAELAMGKPLINDVVITDEFLLPYKGYKKWEMGQAETNAVLAAADRQLALAEAAAEYGGICVYMSVPEQFSYFSEKYPDYMDNRRDYLEQMADAFRAAMDERGLRLLEMGAVFDELGRPEECYYRSDHHYNFAGALVCYHTLMDYLREETGLELAELTEGENLILHESGNRFMGSYGRKLYCLWESEDRLVWGEPTEPVAFTREDNGTASEPYLVKHPDYEWQDIMYAAYMGGDMAETVLRTDRPELPSLLVIGESYTNALETLLWWSFDEMRSLDLRHYTEQSAEEYIRLHQPDIVVVVRDDATYIS